MKKSLLTALIIVVCVFGALLLAMVLRSHATPSSGYTTASSSTISDATSSLDIVNTFAGLANFSARSFASSSANASISFRNFSGNGSSGSVADVYVGQKKAGRIGADSISPFVMSPDGRFAVARTETDFGAYDKYFAIYLVDLGDSSSSAIALPKREEDYQGGEAQFDPRIPYVESVTWHDMNSFDIVLYFIGGSYNEQSQVTYYRISPKQIWRYDVGTKSYSLIQTLTDTRLP